MNFDTCNCYLCCTNQARGQASSKFSSTNKVWVWVTFEMMKPKKPKWYAVVKKILLRSLTAWFSIPPILPFDCSVKLDVPLVKLAAVKECHTRIINCISIFFRYSWHSNPSWVAGKGQMNFLFGVLPTSRGFFSLVFFGREEKPSEY